ncbi:unnamed protein product [Brassicogethes aeneus]|uniref:Uncharacterized protein n=1 Tax=Brassicogethes aeneus TaxID=1431903 RepID=A0A9P0AUE2_BRAAE|nr:unnamed protein product [Brassicogethes aeneus]
MACCAVKDCKNNRKFPTPGISFHVFPKGELQKVWLNLIGKSEENWTWNKNKVICSEHFKNEDFAMRFGKRFLKLNSVPSLKLEKSKPSCQVISTALTLYTDSEASTSKVKTKLQESTSSTDESILKKQIRKKRKIETRGEASQNTSAASTSTDSSAKQKKIKFVKTIHNYRVNTCTMEQTIVKIEPEELLVDSKGDILMNYDKTSTFTDQEMPSTSEITMEQTIVKKEAEELVNDSIGDILMNYNKPSTCTDQEMPSTSGITIKQEMKEELDDDEALLEKGSEIKESDEDNSDHGDEMDRFFCNIKEEGRDGYFSEEDDKNLSDSEEKDEDEAMFETKIEVEYHGVQYDDQSGKEKLFKCDLCPKKYDSKRGVSQHKKFFHFKDEQEQFKCDQCDYVTVRKGIFKRHLKVHEKNNNLKCQFCEFKALELWSLNAHLLSKHKLEKEEREKIKQISKIYECSKCLYLTIKKSQYDGHIKFCLKLENVKWHKCDICHYQSIRKRLLEIHMKIHNKIKEFKCFFCLFSCHKKNEVDNHILRKHPDFLNEFNISIITSKILCCQNCNYRTTFNSDLKRHFKRNHGENAPIIGDPIKNAI